MKRSPIRPQEYLAAALACLLPQEQRDILRRDKVPAASVIRLFSPDHIGLHCFEEPDRDLWYNLNPMLRVLHKEKSRIDTGKAAKVKRLAPPADPINPHLRKLIKLGVADETGKALPGELSRPKRERPKIAQKKNPWPPKGSRRITNRKKP
jgi:hypothetical protein